MDSHLWCFVVFTLCGFIITLVHNIGGAWIVCAFDPLRSCALLWLVWVGVRWCASVCVGVRRCALVCVGVRRCVST